VGDVEFEGGATGGAVAHSFFDSCAFGAPIRGPARVDSLVAMQIGKP